MPHQCVRCGELYEDSSAEVLSGCPCGAKIFYYIKPEKFKEIKEQQKRAPLKKEEREKMEEDVYDLIGDDIDRNVPIVLDIESIEILKPGKYHLDLVKLFQKQHPLIYKTEDGKYIVDLVESFKRIGSGEKKTKKKA